VTGREKEREEETEGEFAPDCKTGEREEGESENGKFHIKL
jgi:hypothetical protein